MSIHWNLEGLGVQRGKPHGLLYTGSNDHYDLEVRKVDLAYHWFATRKSGNPRKPGNTMSSLDTNPNGFSSPISAQKDCDRWLHRKRIV